MCDTDTNDKTSASTDHARAVGERSKLCIGRSSESRLTPGDLAQYAEIKKKCTHAHETDRPLKVRAHEALCENLLQQFVVLMDQCSQAATEQAGMEAGMEMDQALHVIAAQASDLKRLREENDELHCRQSEHQNTQINAIAFKRYKDFYHGCRELQRGQEQVEEGERGGASEVTGRGA